MIVVTGATGALNGATVDRLLELLPAAEIAVAVRDANKAQRFADQGVEIRLADYADPASLRPAFEGADRLLLVSSNDPGADAVALHRNAVDAAVDAGVGRVFYTSHQGAVIGSPFGPGNDHAETEQILAESGLAWTSLRNGFYAHSIGWLLGPWRNTGVVAVPADGPVSWTAREDAAEAAAVILASDSAYDGPITLTAAEAPTFADLATVASEVTGRDIGFTVVDPGEWVSDRVAGGSPKFVAEFTLGMYLAAAEGKFAGVDPLLGELLGREPKTVRDVFVGVE